MLAHRPLLSADMVPGGGEGPHQKSPVSTSTMRHGVEEESSKGGEGGRSWATPRGVVQEEFRRSPLRAELLELFERACIARGGRGCGGKEAGIGRRCRMEGE